jgi:hypothetical protein
MAFLAPARHYLSELGKAANKLLLNGDFQVQLGRVIVEIRRTGICQLLNFAAARLPKGAIKCDK